MSTLIYGIVMYFIIFLIAAAVQFLLCAKLRRIRLLPIIAILCGIVCGAVLLIPRGLMRDPLFENRYFSLFLLTLLLTAAVGCLAGKLASGMLKK